MPKKLVAAIQIPALLLGLRAPAVFAQVEVPLSVGSPGIGGAGTAGGGIGDSGSGTTEPSFQDSLHSSLPSPSGAIGTISTLQPAAKTGSSVSRHFAAASVANGAPASAAPVVAGLDAPVSRPAPKGSAAFGTHPSISPPSANRTRNGNPRALSASGSEEGTQPRTASPIASLARYGPLAVRSSSARDAADAKSGAETNFTQSAGLGDGPDAGGDASAPAPVAAPPTPSGGRAKARSSVPFRKTSAAVDANGRPHSENSDAARAPGSAAENAADAARRILTLENGMRVTLLRDPSVFSADIAVAYAVGGRDEPQGETGYTHFVEHLMFQGTRRIRNWFRMVGAMAAHTSAYTYRDHTVYTQTLPREFLELGISLEAERMANLEVTPEKVEREKGTILEEKAGQDDRPYASGWRKLTELLFDNPRNRSDVIGSEADIRAATPEKLRRYLDAYYTPDRANVVISGNIDLERTEEWVREYLGAVPARARQAPAADLAEPPRTARRAAEVLDPYAGAPALLFGWQGPRYGTPDYYAAGILALLLQDRLHAELVIHRKSATGVSAVLPYLERDPVALQGSITLTSRLNPADARAALDAALEALRRGAFSEEELFSAVDRQVQWADSQLRGSGGAAQFALAGARGLDADALARDIARWRGVTAEQVRAAARRLAPEKTSLVTVSPEAAGATPRAAVAGGRVHEHRTRVDETPTEEETALLERLAGYEWEPMSYLAPTELTLENGLKIIVLPDGRVPTVHAKLAFRLGATAADGEAREKVPFAAQLMRLRTAATPEGGLERALERIAGTLHTTQKWDHVVFDGNAPADQGLELLRLMAEIVARPHAWTEAELAPWKAWWKDSLRRSAADPGIATHQRAVQDLLGAHPSARATLTPEAVDALSPEEFARLIRDHFSPGNAVLVVAGDVDVERVRELVPPLFLEWRGSAAAAEELPAAQVRPQDWVSLLERPHSEQNLIRLSGIGVDAGRQSSPDFFPMIVGDRILGNGFGSRLFQVLRQTMGLAYHAFSSVVTDPAVAMWTFGLYTKPEKTGPALRALLDEARRMREERPSRLELGSAKNAIIGAFLLSLDHVGDIADHLLGLELFRQPLAEWGLYPGKVAEVTGAAVQRTAAKLLDPRRLAITIAGDIGTIRGELSQTRPVLDFDAEGRPKFGVKP